MTRTTLDGSATPFVVAAGSVEIANDGDALVLLGTIDNLGTLSLAGTGTQPSGPPDAANFASLILATPTVTLTGGGTLLLAGASDTETYAAAAAGATLVNVDNTIEGAGNIGSESAEPIGSGVTAYPLSLVNDAGGVIDSNTNPTGGLGSGIFISASASAPTIVNSGLLEATGSGGMIITADTIDQSGGGTILASGSNDAVFFQGITNFFGADVIGGTLQTTGGGDIIGIGTLDGSTAAVTIGAGTDIDDTIGALLGTIDNFGTLDIGGPSLEPNNTFLVTPTVTLKGGGSIIGPVFTLPGGNGGLATLVNVDNTLSGVGTLGLSGITNSTFGPFGTAAPLKLINEAAGVIDANVTGGFVFSLYGGGVTLTNDGILEATTGGSLSLDGEMLDQSGGGTLQAVGAGANILLQSVDIVGGTMLASGAGALITFQTADISTDVLDATDGGLFKFNVGDNTVDSPGGTLTIAAGGMVEAISDRGYNTTGTLTLQAPVIDNLGTLIAASSVVLAGPTVTLGGGGVVQVTGTLDATAATSLTNVDNSFSDLGSGTGMIVGNDLSLTNDAAGVIAGVGLDGGGTIVNAGLLENMAIGTGTVTVIHNIGSGRLLATGANEILNLTDVDVQGGHLAATDGGLIEFNIVNVTTQSTNTLDGTTAPVTIDAGTTLQDFYPQAEGGGGTGTVEANAGLMLVGTVDLFGTIEGPAPINFYETPLDMPNAGVLTGTGTVQSWVNNTGTLLAQGGTLTVIGDIDGAGSIAIAGGGGGRAGGVFDLTGATGETVDFRTAPFGTLALATPKTFTGTFANLALGDTIDLGIASSIVSAKVISGTTLALAMADASTIDYALANLQAKDTFEIKASVAHPVETYDFSYVGAGTSADPSYSVTATGSLTVEDDGGSASLADVIAFNLTLDSTATNGPHGSGTDHFTYTLGDLINFGGTFDSGGTLTGLTLGTDTTEESRTYTNNQSFNVLDLGSDGADTAGPDGETPATTGSLVLTPEGTLLSSLVVACFAEGTRIATAHGEAAVETLAVGDIVRTKSGRLAPVRWLGRRHVDCARHPRPRDVWPVRIRAHAFGPQQPHRDLLLSPDHAVFVHGALIPVRHLVDGIGIVPQRRASVTYWHVELDRHDVVLAEGLACESFLDSGQRSAFAQAGMVVDLHPDFARRLWDGDACAPIVVAGPLLAHARAMLLQRQQGQRQQAHEVG